MKRKLYTQILTEWRSNLWLVIELTVVSLVIWTIIFLLFVETKGLRMPRGFDPDNVYVATPQEVSKESPRYIPSDDNGYYRDLADIVNRLKRDPAVESVAVASSCPYYLDYYGTSATPADFSDTIFYSANLRMCTPEYIDVFRIKSLAGTPSARLKEMLGRDEILISDNMPYQEKGRKPADLKGKRVFIDNDSSKTYRIADVIENIRRSDYEEARDGTILRLMPADHLWGTVVIRVRPGHETRFEESFRENVAMRSQRNVYLTDLRPLSQVRETAQRDVATSINTKLTIMLFMLATIFLGLLGSFWFRMQQRVGEIAIRKVCGATRRQIFTRVISEGMILLLAATIVAAACVWPFHSDICEYLDESWTPILVCEIVAAAIIAVGIVISLWWPARRAMSIDPAEAIKAE